MKSVFIKRASTVDTIVTPSSCTSPIYPAVATHWAIRSVAAKICHISPATGHTLSNNICWRVRNSNMMEDQYKRSDVPDLICTTPHTGRYLSDLVCTDKLVETDRSDMQVCGQLNSHKNYSVTKYPMYAYVLRFD